MQVRDVFTLLACLFMVASGSAAEPSVQLYGEVKVLGWRSATNSSTFTRPFHLAVSGSNWWMTTYPSWEEIGDTNFHWQVFSITNGLLGQCYFSPDVNRLFATLKPLVAPVACPDGVSQFIWLMLTPSVQADAENKAVLPPIYNPSADFGTNPDLRRHCKVEYLDKSRLWLRQIRFFSDGTFNSYSNGINRTRSFPEPWGEGFLEARFETVGVTNWNGLIVPRKVIGEIISPGSGSAQSLFRTNKTIEINVMGIQGLSPGFTLPPRPTSTLALTDARAPAGKDKTTLIGFRIHDGEWPSLEFSRSIVEEDERKRAALGLPPR